MEGNHGFPWAGGFSPVRRLVEDWDGVVFVTVIGYPKPMSPQWPREGGQNSKFFLVGLKFEMEEIPTNVIFKTQELTYTLPPIIMVQ